MKNQWSIVSVKPVFGENYDAGWLGFTFHDSSFVSSGIAWFTRWEQGDHEDLPSVPLSHVLVVSGPKECVEATTPKTTRSPLSKYFDDPTRHILFRKPAGWTPEAGLATVAKAESRIGEKYDYPLFVGQLVSQNVFGRLLNIVTFGLARKVVLPVLNKRNALICSELAAWCLIEAGYPLKRSPAEYTPQSLFQDPCLTPLDWSRRPT